MVNYLEDGYFTVTTTRSPLLVTDGYKTPLEQIDPVLYWITTYFENVLKIHLTDKWNYIMPLVNRNDLINEVVSETLPYDPLPFLADNQFRFPLLCVYRMDETYANKTAAWYNVNSRFGVVYCLPPLMSSQLELVNPFLTQVARVLVDRTRNGLDSNYMNGTAVWKEAGLDSIGCSATTYGKIPGIGNDAVFFPSLLMTLEVQERNMPTIINYPAFTGSDSVVESGNIEVIVSQDLTGE